MLGILALTTMAVGFPLGSYAGPLLMTMLGGSDGPVHGTTPAGSPEATAHDSVVCFKLRGKTPSRNETDSIFRKLSANLEEMSRLVHRYTTSSVSQGVASKQNANTEAPG